MVVLTTKLEAVNVILDVMGLAPVASLGFNQDATYAETTLDEVNRRVQSKGWYFNTVTEDLTADGAGTITLPTNVARFDWPRTDVKDPDLVMRVNTVSGVMEAYDVLNNTFTLTANKVFKDCRLVQLLEFDEIPEAARQYIMIVAGRTEQDRAVSSPARARFSREDEFRAMIEMRREEMKAGDHSVFDSSVPYNIIRRRGYFSRGY